MMRKEDYLHILQTNLPDIVDESVYPEYEVILQQDRYPKHITKIVKDWLAQQGFQVIE